MAGSARRCWRWSRRWSGSAALLVGGFSRFGLWRQIFGGIVALIVLKSFDNAMAGLVRREAAPWLATYASSVVGLALAGALLWIAAPPGLLSRRRRVAA